MGQRARLSEINRGSQGTLDPEKAPLEAYITADDFFFFQDLCFKISAGRLHLAEALAAPLRIGLFRSLFSFSHMSMYIYVYRPISN